MCNLKRRTLAPLNAPAIPRGVSEQARGIVQVISFLNMKGGVGKTTLAVNIAYGLAWVHKKNVLVVDADPQFNATQYLLGADNYLQHLESKKGTLHDIFLPKRPGPLRTVPGTAKKINKARMPLSECICAIVSENHRGKLDLIPSTLELWEIDTSRRGTETRLSSFLKEKATGYDYVIVDCPPTISIFMQAAILASDKYVVPIKPDPLSVIGLPLLEHWLEEFADDFGVRLPSVGLVFTLVRGPAPARMREVMAELRKDRKDQVFSNYLSQSIDVSSSVEACQPVFRFKPGSKTAGQLLNITEEFLARTRQKQVGSAG